MEDLNFLWIQHEPYAPRTTFIVEKLSIPDADKEISLETFPWKTNAYESSFEDSLRLP